MSEVRFILADPDESFRHLLFSIVVGAGGCVVAETNKAAETIWLATRCKPDALYLDARLGITEIIEAIKEIKLRNPQIRIVVASDSVMCREATLYAGADAFLVKNGDPAQHIVAVLSLLN